MLLSVLLNGYHERYDLRTSFALIHVYFHPLHSPPPFYSCPLLTYADHFYLMHVQPVDVEDSHLAIDIFPSHILLHYRIAFCLYHFGFIFEASIDWPKSSYRCAICIMHCQCDSICSIACNPENRTSKTTRVVPQLTACFCATSDVYSIGRHDR